MIREIQSYIHSATGTAYATCRSSKYGLCTQWGASEMDAVGKLKIFVEIHWKEKWPEVTQNTPDNKALKQTGLDSGYCGDCLAYHRIPMSCPKCGAKPPAA